MQKGTKGFALESAEMLRRMFRCKRDDGGGEQSFLGYALEQTAAMVGSAI